MGPELILLAQLGAGSPEGARISQRQLVDAPKSYVERRIVIPGIACINPGKGDFLCIAVVAGRALRIEAGLLGAKTALPIAEALIGECKGTANIKNAACVFDAEITPANTMTDMMETASGSMPIVVVYSGQVDLYRPKR
ncbi:hypothetical protein [Methylobacterium aquaticum]|uniref:Uncharacterized protein n=1 Tax=Methylobacterium aquaticum TaxID=270351 RepID=A0A0C6FCG4_9HYPH|nr:hypothetical protein [Methylobacterium aquaticum]BAQ50391.1 hypothetical protein Maq22A_4p60180 [Methylobacterium aquaticum]